MASSLTSQQVSSIVLLLQSFGADPSVIANVQATLIGQATTAATSSPCLNLTYNLYAGMTDSQSGGQVSQLQQFLGITPTGYFGSMTQQRVQNWQTAHGVVSSGSPDAIGHGTVGPQTREAMGCGGTVISTPQTRIGPAATPTTQPTPMQGSQIPSTVDSSTIQAVLAVLDNDKVLLNSGDPAKFEHTCNHYKQRFPASPPLIRGQQKNLWLVIPKLCSLVQRLPHLGSMTLL